MHRSAPPSPTDRHYRSESFDASIDISYSGLTDWREIRKALDAKFKADYHREKFTGMAYIDARRALPSVRRVRFVKRKPQLRC